MKYSYSNWNHKHGTIPVFWNKDNYQNASWYRHPDRTHGFTTDDKNYDIYGENLGVYIPDIKKMDLVFAKTLEFFDLKNLVFNLSKYSPGMILPWHKDNYPTYRKNKGILDLESVVRIMILLEDAAPGHQLWIEDRYCTGKAGSWFSWQGSTKHMAANLGEVDRYVIQITGQLPSNTSANYSP